MAQQGQGFFQLPKRVDPPRGRKQADLPTRQNIERVPIAQDRRQPQQFDIRGIGSDGKALTDVGAEVMSFSMDMAQAEARERAQLEAISLNEVNIFVTEEMSLSNAKVNLLDKDAVAEAGATMAQIADKALKDNQGSDTYNAKLESAMRIAMQSQTAALSSASVKARQERVGTIFGQEINLQRAQSTGDIILDLQNIEAASFRYSQLLGVPETQAAALKEMQATTSFFFNNLMLNATDANMEKAGRLLQTGLIRSIMGPDATMAMQKAMRDASDVRFNREKTQTDLQKRQASVEAAKKVMADGNQAPITAEDEAQYLLTGEFGKLDEGQKTALTREANLTAASKGLIDAGKPDFSEETKANYRLTGNFTESAAVSGERKVEEAKSILNRPPTEEERKRIAKVNPPRDINVTTNVDTQGDAFEKKSGTLQATQIGTDIDKSRVAVATIDQLNIMTKTLDTKAFEPGSFADSRASLSKLAKFVEGVVPGAKFDALVTVLGSAAAGNTFDTAAKNLALTMAKDIGRITNMSLKLALDSVPGLFRTRLGNQIAIAIMRKGMERTIAYARFGQEAFRDGTLFPEQGPDYYQKIMEYDKTHPTFDKNLTALFKQVKDEYEARSGGGSAGAITIPDLEDPVAPEDEPDAEFVRSKRLPDGDPKAKMYDLFRRPNPQPGQKKVFAQISTEQDQDQDLDPTPGTADPAPTQEATPAAVPDLQPTDTIAQAAEKVGSNITVGDVQDFVSQFFEENPDATADDVMQSDAFPENTKGDKARDAAMARAKSRKKKTKTKTKTKGAK